MKRLALILLVGSATNVKTEDVNSRLRRVPVTAWVMSLQKSQKNLLQSGNLSGASSSISLVQLRTSSWEPSRIGMPTMQKSHQPVPDAKEGCTEGRSGGDRVPFMQGSWLFEKTCEVRLGFGHLKGASTQGLNEHAVFFDL